MRWEKMRWMVAPVFLLCQTRSFSSLARASIFSASSTFLSSFYNHASWPEQQGQQFEEQKGRKITINQLIEFDQCIRSKRSSEQTMATVLVSTITQNAPPTACGWPPWWCSRSSRRGSGSSGPMTTGFDKRPNLFLQTLTQYSHTNACYCDTYPKIGG